jgi:hypothetical protein
MNIHNKKGGGGGGGFLSPSVIVGCLPKAKTDTTGTDQK